MKNIRKLPFNENDFFFSFSTFFVVVHDNFIIVKRIKADNSSSTSSRFSRVKEESVQLKHISRSHFYIFQLFATKKIILFKGPSVLSSFLEMKKFVQSRESRICVRANQRDNRSRIWTKLSAFNCSRIARQLTLVLSVRRARAY